MSSALPDTQGLLVVGLLSNFLPWNLPLWENTPLAPLNLLLNLSQPSPLSLPERPLLCLKDLLRPLLLGLVIYGLYGFLFGFPSISILNRTSVSLSILSDRGSSPWKWILLLVPLGALIRVKGAVAPFYFRGFAVSGFLA